MRCPASRGPLRKCGKITVSISRPSKTGSSLSRSCWEWRRDSSQYEGGPPNRGATNGGAISLGFQVHATTSSIDKPRFVREVRPGPLDKRYSCGVGTRPAFQYKVRPYQKKIVATAQQRQRPSESLPLLCGHLTSHSVSGTGHFYNVFVSSGSFPAEQRLCRSLALKGLGPSLLSNLAGRVQLPIPRNPRCPSLAAAPCGAAPAAAFRLGISCGKL
jgi:hypothetical protein